MKDSSTLRWIFCGRNGFRSGWSLALYVSLFASIVAAESWGARSLHSGDLWSEMLREFEVLSAAVIASLIMSRIEQRPWHAYGLPLRSSFSRLFWVGAIWGFLAISLLLEALHGLRVFDFGHIVLRGGRIIEFAVFWALLFLLVGLFEEFLLRGYAQFTLARGIGFWPAAVVLSCLFGGSHLRNQGETWAGALAGVVMGLFFCLTLRRTGNLWFAVAFHGSWDWGESFFYSVPDSGEVSPGHLLSSSFHGPKWLTGGSVGPEASVLCLVAIVIVWIAFDRVYPNTTRVHSQRGAQK
jgi:CAAX protease family protein